MFSVQVYPGGVGGAGDGGNPPGRALVESCEGWVLSPHWQSSHHSEDIPHQAQTRLMSEITTRSDIT